MEHCANYLHFQATFETYSENQKCGRNMTLTARTPLQSHTFEGTLEFDHADQSFYLGMMLTMPPKVISCFPYSRKYLDMTLLIFSPTGLFSQLKNIRPANSGQIDL